MKVTLTIIITKLIHQDKWIENVRFVHLYYVPIRYHLV